jgi:hypothetical protein
MVIPTDFTQLSVTLCRSEVDIEWDLTAPPTVDFGAVAAATTVAGAPGLHPVGGDPLAWPPSGVTASRHGVTPVSM